MMWLLLSIGVLGVLGIVFGIWWWRRQPRISRQQSKIFWTQWRRMEKLPDSYRQVLEADAIVGNVLIELGFGETFGEALKQKSEQIPNLEAVWKAHKLRNTLAHEPGTAVTTAQAQSALHAFLPILKKFCHL